MALPNWATKNEDTVEVNGDVAYPLYLEQLELLFPEGTSQAFKVAVAKICITRDLAVQGYQSIRFRGGKGKWDSATLNEATDATTQAKAEADHEAGLKAAGSYRNRLLKKRAEQLALPQ